MTTRPKGSVLNLVNVCGVVSAADLGPVGSNITTALAAALNNGNPVFIPAGTWVISGLSLPAGASIRGVGPASILQLAPTSNTTAITVGSNSVLYDFALDCNKSNQVGSGLNGLDFTNAVRCRARGVTVYNPKGSGIVIGGSAAELDFLNTVVYGYTEHGVKITAGTDLTLINTNVHDSDPAATGDGIAVQSYNGANISQVLIDSPRVTNVTNRGISCIGSNNTRNVTDSVISNARVISATSHGIHCMFAETIAITAGLISSCSGDGIRFESDVQHSCATNVTMRANIGYGLREVTNGSSPNYNNFTYNQYMANGNNAPVKVGANSVIV